MIGLVVFFGLWEVLVRAFDVRTFVLLRPSTILAELAGQPGFYWRNTMVTAREALLGYLVALAVALLWGALMARSRFLEQASTPVAVLIQVTPIVAYAPSAVLWLGRGLRPIVFITGLICLVPLLFGVTTGLRSADLAALDLMAVVDAPGREVLRRIRLPYALPYLFSATRTCVGLALIGAVLAEWYALVDQGLGGFLENDYLSAAPLIGDRAYAAQYGKFKVPTLRNIGLTAPYGHNGVFPTLRSVVDFHNTRDVADWPPPEVAQNLNTQDVGDMGLTPAEVDDAVAFLMSLSDDLKMGP
jgi:NitT/TauT family transport system permease protein